MARVFASCFAASVCAFSLVGCGESRANTHQGAVVFGITSDFQPGPDIARLQADLQVEEGAVKTLVWAAGKTPELTFPLEVRAENGAADALVTLRLSGYEGFGSAEIPFVERTISTHFVAEKTLLARTHLEWECVPNYHLPGGDLAPICKPPLTCVAAECDDPFVEPSHLEVYTPNWFSDFADACRPEGAGPPEVMVGQGLETFSPLSPAAPLMMEKGSQGGYHVWIALRQKNLHQKGSYTSVSIERNDTLEELCAVEIPWDFTPIGDGEVGCELAGIRCVVSYDAAAAAALTGKEVVVKARVVDLLGDVGFGEQATMLTPPP
ncbi:MAG: hypothetical protein IPK82_20855 [Polyangiaceae bacterium]|nr:hypothetical protein [Polyangiaceae bacterium]